MGGKKKSYIVGYYYYFGMHMVLHAGQCDYVKRVRTDETTVFEDDWAQGARNTWLPDLYGGEAGEGGIGGTMVLYNGNPNQQPSPYLQSVLGTTQIPAFIGVTSLIFQRFYVGINPYIKSWDFRSQRIMYRDSGRQQWYPERAAIPITNVSVGDLVAPTSDWEYIIREGTLSSIPPVSSIPSNSENWQTGRAPFGYDTSWGSSPNLPYRINTLWPHNTHIWMRKQITVNGSTDVNVSASYHDNAVYIYVDGNFIATDNATNEQVSGAPGFNLNIPRQYLSAGDHMLYICCTDDREDTYLTYIYAQVRYISYLGMNPAHIIHEALTDPEYGLGLSETEDLDDANFRQAADDLNNESFPMCVDWNSDSTTLDDLIKEVCDTIDASLYIDRKTGKYCLQLIRDDYDDTALLRLDEDNVQSIEDYKTPNPDEMVNTLELTYYDLFLGDDSTISLADIALYQVQGGAIKQKVTYDGIPTSELADRVCQRDLRSYSQIGITCTVIANSDAEDLHIGSVFYLSWSKLDLYNVVMRVTSISYGTDTDHTVKIECTEDIYGTPAGAQSGGNGGEWVPPNNSPTNALNKLFYEIPYFELVREESQGVIDVTLDATPTMGRICATGRKPTPTSALARLYVDNGIGYQEETSASWCPTGYANNVLENSPASTTLNLYTVDLADLGMDSESGTPELLQETLAYIGDEIVAITNADFTTNTLTIKRGVLDTIPVEHNEGESLFIFDGYDIMGETQFMQNETLAMKLRTVAAGGTLSLPNTDTDYLTIQARAIRPYPPANVRFNGVYNPMTLGLDADLTITWSHRDRLQQTASSFVSYFDGDIGPEPNTTYTLIIYNSNGDVIDEIATIEGNSYSIPASTIVQYGEQAGSYLFTFVLFSVRDEWESLYRNSFTIELVAPDIIFDDDLAFWGDSYSRTFTIVNSSITQPTWSITTGTLPPDLTLNSSTGEVSGTLNKA